MDNEKINKIVTLKLNKGLLREFQILSSIDEYGLSRVDLKICLLQNQEQVNRKINLYFKYVSGVEAGNELYGMENVILDIEDISDK